MIRWIVFVAALSGGIGVCVGAIGAHGLPANLEKQGFEPERIEKKVEQCEIAVRYQLFHAPVLLALGLGGSLMKRSRVRGAAVSFLIGTCLFSGGLYSMVFLDMMGHWSIVPSGGVSLIVGWCFVMGAALGAPAESEAKATSET